MLMYIAVRRERGKIMFYMCLIIVRYSVLYAISLCMLCHPSKIGDLILPFTDEDTVA